MSVTTFVSISISVSISIRVCMCEYIYFTLMYQMSVTTDFVESMCILTCRVGVQTCLGGNVGFVSWNIQLFR